jgi:hypothetical protein
MAAISVSKRATNKLRIAQPSLPLLVNDAQKFRRNT